MKPLIIEPRGLRSVIRGNFREAEQTIVQNIRKKY